MKSWQRMGIVVGVAAATVLWADGALAAGRTQTRAGTSKSSVARTTTGTQTRQRLRDGSCLTTGTTAGTGDRLRLRDGTCLTK